MGENHFSELPTAFYGVNLFMAAIAYTILQKCILYEDDRSALAHALGKDRKGLISPVIYLVAIVSAFYEQWIAQMLYVAVALMWLIPDRRIEREIREQAEMVE